MTGSQLTREEYEKEYMADLSQFNPEPLRLIIAGDARQAAVVAGLMGWPRKNWTFVDDTHKFHGRDGVIIVWWGTYSRRPDIGRIADAADYLVRNGRATQEYPSV